MPKTTEDAFADHLVSLFAESIQPHKVERKRSLLYDLSINHRGVVTMGVDPDSGEPIRGRGRGFEQDILIFDEIFEGHTSVIPLVIAEVKFGSVTTHDVIVYSEKADRIRRIYPYVRYGFVLGGLTHIPGRVLRLGQRFDFITAISDGPGGDELERFQTLMKEEVAASVPLTELLFGKKARPTILQKRLVIE